MVRASARCWPDVRRAWPLAAWLAVLLAGTGRSLAAQAAPSSTLTATVARALVEEGLIGASWSLVTPEQVVLGAAGVRDLGTSAPLSPHDRVQVGSVAKTILAA